jgi:hypothetical protein
MEPPDFSDQGFRWFIKHGPTTVPEAASGGQAEAPPGAWMPGGAYGVPRVLGD